jgi:hypothetical protein
VPVNAHKVGDDALQCSDRRAPKNGPEDAVDNRVMENE